MVHSTEFELKTELRTELRQRRSVLTPAKLTEYSAGFTATGLDLLAALPLTAQRQTIAGYLSVAAEPPVLDLLGEFSSAGHHVLMPVCEPRRQLSWVGWEPGCELQTSRFAPIQEPVGDRLGIEALDSAALMILPALAVDRSGTRLGQGGGYYDRLLARLRERNSEQPLPVLAAAVYAEDLLPATALPREERDQPVQFALTPEFFCPLEC